MIFVFSSDLFMIFDVVLVLCGLILLVADRLILVLGSMRIGMGINGTERRLNVETSK